MIFYSKSKSLFVDSTIFDGFHTPVYVQNHANCNGWVCCHRVRCCLSLGIACTLHKAANCGKNEWIFKQSNHFKRKWATAILVCWEYTDSEILDKEYCWPNMEYQCYAAYDFEPCWKFRGYLSCSTSCCICKCRFAVRANLFDC